MISELYHRDAIAKTIKVMVDFVTP